MWLRTVDTETTCAASCHTSSVSCSTGTAVFADTRSRTSSARLRAPATCTVRFPSVTTNGPRIPNSTGLTAPQQRSLGTDGNRSPRSERLPGVVQRRLHSHWTPPLQCEHRRPPKERRAGSDRGCRVRRVVPNASERSSPMMGIELRHAPTVPHGIAMPNRRKRRVQRPRLDGTESVAELARIPMFAPCTSAELVLVDRLSCTIRVPAGAVVAVEGRPAVQVLYVIAGWARRTREGELLGVVHAGACIGADEVDRRAVHSVTIETETEMVVRAFSLREFASLRRAVPRLAFCTSAGEPGIGT